MKGKEPSPDKGQIIYTLGTSNRTLEEFLALMGHYGIGRILDVRRFPKSRFEHFGGEELAGHLRSRGIEYSYLGEELGGYRKEGYETYLQSRAFMKGLRRASALAQGSTSALLCAERLPWKCHRRFIARVLEEQGWRVTHIIEVDRVWVPKN